MNDLFFSDTSAEWDIFETQFDKLKPLSQAEITFFATKKLMNIIIQPGDFFQTVDLLMSASRTIFTFRSL
jgi:hypothetical protein